MKTKRKKQCKVVILSKNGYVKLLYANAQCVCIVCTKYQNNYSKFQSQNIHCLSTQDPQEEALSKKQYKFVILSKNGYAGIKFFKQCSVCLHCVYKASE